MSDNVYNVGDGRDFVVFNDQDLSMEPVTSADLEPVEVIPGSESIKIMRSQTWSCNMDWYFIICEDSILLLHVHANRGFRCKKKSAMFIQWFLDQPRLRKRGRK